MSDLNKVFLIGRLTRDPEKSYTPNGTCITKFSVAVNNGFGENRKTAFIDVTAWSKSAEFVANYFSKGKEILIEGRLEFDTWESKEGDRRSKLYVTAERASFVGSKNDQPGGSGEASSSGYSQNTPPSPSPIDDDPVSQNISDDDIPF